MAKKQSQENHNNLKSIPESVADKRRDWEDRKTFKIKNRYNNPLIKSYDFNFNSQVQRFK